MTQSGLKTRSSKGGGTENYNEILFEDKKGEELISIHAEKDMVETVENNFTRSVGGGLNGDPKKIGKSWTTVYGDHSLTVQKGDMTVTVEAGKKSVTVEKEIDVKSNTSFIHVESPTEIMLTVKGSFIEITPDTITLHAAHIKVEGGTDIKIVTPDLDAEGSTQVQDARQQGHRGRRVRGLLPVLRRDRPNFTAAIQGHPRRRRADGGVRHGRGEDRRRRGQGRGHGGVRNQRRDDQAQLVCVVAGLCEAGLPGWMASPGSETPATEEDLPWSASRKTRSSSASTT